MDKEIPILNLHGDWVSFLAPGYTLSVLPVGKKSGLKSTLISGKILFSPKRVVNFWKEKYRDE